MKHAPSSRITARVVDPGPLVPARGDEVDLALASVEVIEIVERGGADTPALGERIAIAHAGLGEGDARRRVGALRRLRIVRELPARAVLWGDAEGSAPWYAVDLDDDTGAGAGTR